MKNFLNAPGAAFYHITTSEKWESIKVNGFHAPRGKIFVTRTEDFNVNISIYSTQLVGIEDLEKVNLSLLRFPQNSNDFQVSEVFLDMQANEPTMPLHNILLRNYISTESIELVCQEELSMLEITRRTMQCDVSLQEMKAYQEGFELIYNNSIGCHRLMDIQFYQNVPCP